MRLRRLLLAVVVLGIGVPDAPAADLLSFYRQAMAAREAGEYQVYRENLEAALALEPGHPVLLHHLARAHAQLDQPEQALARLHEALALGAASDVAADPWLRPLHEEVGWGQAVVHADRAAAPQGAGMIGFELDEYDLLPEGIAHDPATDSFFLSSVSKRKIVRRWPDGSSEDFVPAAAHGFLGGLGMTVDVDDRRLWACAAYDAAWMERAPDDTLQTGLWCWSLEDGALLERWTLPADSTGHSYADVALHPDGRVLVTDSVAGSVLVLAAGTSELVPIVEGLRGPNGLALDGEGQHLYVSEWGYGIRRVDLRTGETQRLAHGPELTTVGVDGLVHHDGSLYVVQNYAGLDRTARFDLDPTGHRITGCTVLEAHHPRMDDPTTAVIAHGQLWFVANSHIAGYDRRGERPDADAWGRVLVLRTEL